jgi:hypothetical protein
MRDAFCPFQRRSNSLHVGLCEGRGFDPNALQSLFCAPLCSARAYGVRKYSFLAYPALIPQLASSPRERTSFRPAGSGRSKRPALQIYRSSLAGLLHRGCRVSTGARARRPAEKEQSAKAAAGGGCAPQCYGPRQLVGRWPISRLQERIKYDKLPPSV